MLFTTSHLLHDIINSHEYKDMALSIGVRCQSFYKGNKEENRSASPYLLELKAGSLFANRYFKYGWGQAWGVPVYSSASFEDVYRHFRRFLMIRIEDGQQLYFRFYDPRVLRIFLPTCDASQIREFFGPIEYFLAEDEDPAFALKFSQQNGLLQTERFSIKDEIAALPEPLHQESETIGSLQNEDSKSSLTDTGPPTPPVIAKISASFLPDTGNNIADASQEQSLKTKKKWNTFD